MGTLELDVPALAADEEAMLASARKFALEVLRPAGIALDRLPPEDVAKQGSILWEVYRKYQEHGFHRLAIPKDLGGVETSPLLLNQIVEQLGYGDAGLCESLLCSIASFLFAAMYGGPTAHDLVRTYCNDTSGRMIGCFAFTEPDHGSDWVLASGPGADDPRRGPSVKAVRKGTTFVIQGQKSAFISNGPVASHAFLFLGLEPSRGMRGLGAAFLPLDLPGISRGKPLDKLGLRSYPQGALVFDDVEIPESMMVLQDPEASLQALRLFFTLGGEVLSALNVGLAQAALDQASRYAKARTQGGKPIFEHQSVALRLFKMFTMVESARAYSRRVGLYNAAHRPGSALHSTSCKVHCTESAFKVAGEALQVLGGYGLSREYPVEKMFRDARMGLIGEENDALSLAVADLL
jgi:alkylation response protein AidB-like acyl-CoA dehydrogenase